MTHASLAVSRSLMRTTCLALPLMLSSALVAGTHAVAADSVRVASVSDTKVDGKPAAPSRNPTSVRTSVRGPMQIVISIPDQRMDVYDGTVKVASTRVSTGKRGHRTPKGVFSVIQKNRRHFSNIYNNAPMPYMQRLTWSGIALHAGAVPNYPASHGCIRMPYSFARKLFGMTDKNAKIIVNSGRQVPKVIQHDTLFQPRPRPVRDLAGSIQAMTLDGLDADSVSGRDAIVLANQKADAFAVHLRAAHHPNFGARPRAHIILTQRLLGFLGYAIARPDGDLGRITRGEIRKFQKSQGMKVTGRISDALTRRLYHAVGLMLVTTERAKADDMLTPRAADAPLRILITRHKPEDDAKRAQKALIELGYLSGFVDGVVGPATRAAIVTFRDDAGLEPVAERVATVDDELLGALDKANGSTPSSMNGRIFVRQGYRDIYEAPIRIGGGDDALGTHVFSVADLGEDRTATVNWTALTVAEGARKTRKKRRNKRRNRRVADASNSTVPFRVGDAASTLDRIDLPKDVRTYIEQHITPGSSVIVSDHGSSHETGEGTDFIVLTK